MYKAFIEIPKGDDRRRHMKFDKSGLIDLGPIKDVIPVNDGVMPVHYGYILDTLNTEENPPEELDVLIFSDKDYSVSDIVDIKPIALIEREDKDHKIAAVDLDSEKTWEDINETEKELIKDYFGYKSKITSITGQDTAIKLIKKFKI
ncbi:inorganic diphosphatase [Patescibacteria group bacterium]|nr:inorganic diphosphatase [Patescibacteria group bacterium]